MATTQESDVHPLGLGDSHGDEETTQPIPGGSEKTETKKKRRRSSEVWNEFTLIPSQPGETSYCTCNKCGHKFNAESKNGTGNLRRHVLTCQKKTTTEVGQFLVTSDKGILHTPKSNFNQDTFRELVVHAIIRHDLPFSFVEYEGIRNIFSYLESRRTTFTRNTAKSYTKKTYGKEMKRLRDELIACPSRICLTSDAWTSIATDGYLSLTAHYVDSNWVLRKKILNFSHFSPPHSGIALAEKITDMVTSWGIEKKLFSITLDNASANDSCVAILKTNFTSKNLLLHDGELFHVRCCAHILNLIVQDGLKEIDEAVIKIRDSVKYIRGSEGRKIKFRQCISQTSLESKKGLHQDVPTRWNSTYKMLSSAIYYRRALCYYKMCDSNYESCPTEEEWTRVEKISGFLGVFYEATNAFSGSLYPTSNLYFPHVFFIQLHLVERSKSSDKYMKKIAQQMLQKFSKYWSKFNLLLAIAVKALWSRVSRIIKGQEHTFPLFDEYVQHSTTMNTSSCSRGSGDQTMQHNGENSIQSKFFEELEQYTSSELDATSQKSQLELYLEEPTLSRTMSVDVLDFWKSQEFKYPDLARLARDVLCVPISTVASESAFSLGGRILDQYRSSMSPPTVEALACTRDWLFGGTVTTEVKPDEITENVLASYSNNEETNLSAAEVTNSNVVE
ncbi:hypothetical protein OSB04_un001165 [Centaurea solstitialis]|uniref:BED-type domain-containing protein n=1 Tax=Centaurea solstitialis TaxID=347529 RepID=A0AA38VUV1_9ASTR|nr:hypothetical protein OSB04_un001165 [Centaurea solstitialis]